MTTHARALLMRYLRCVAFLSALLFAAPLHAHIGSPDTFIQATAGPYDFLLAAHPPTTYPGALELDLRFAPSDHLTLATVSLDAAQPAGIQLFTDGTASISLWLTQPMAHQLHIAVQGSHGSADYNFTLPAATIPATHQFSTVYRRFLLLVAAGIFLAFSLLLFIASPGNQPSAARNVHPRTTAIGFFALACFFVFLAFKRPIETTRPALSAMLRPDGYLDFTLSSPTETFTDLTPDHNKLVHLFLIREPQHDVFLHLHPQQLSPGNFTTPLPAMPPGTYTLFADFYHADGRGETVTQSLTLPAQSHSATTDPDDSTAILPPLSRADVSLRTAHLPDGYTMQLEAPTHLSPLSANLLQVTLLDPVNQPPLDMQLYLGMPAHAVVLRSDEGVFAHIHPGGTLPMLASRSDMPMPMPVAMTAPTNTATIPYGFPSPGRYRLFVQMKHGRYTETGVFDLDVS
jgi:hypothetical protein